MGDSIYTILIIAWVVYGIYSAVKKNKAKQSSASATPPPQSQPTAIESVFESLFQENTQTYSKVNSPYYKTDSKDESEEPENYQDNYEEYEESEEYEENDYLDTVPEANVVSEIDTYSGTDNVESSFLQEEDSDEIQKSAIDSSEEGENTNSYEFDLRQAVIAQAILERPFK